MMTESLFTRIQRISTWAFVSFVLFAVPLSASAADFPKQEMQLSPETRAWFRNPDGSCVQCSIGMCGVHCNDPNATCLLWSTSYGPAERGGSNSSRVANYCNKRGIGAYNITGWPTTRTWMQWAARTGRFAAIGAGGSHFQTLYGYEPATDTWEVCNNNSTHKVDVYNNASFERLHLASGPWIVILKRSSSENPKLVKWWK